MGNDFDSRKSNKKAWKRQSRSDEGGERRVRRKKTVKRIIRGDCYKHPQLELDSSDEDMIASSKKKKTKMSTGTNLIVPKGRTGDDGGGGRDAADASVSGLHDVIRRFCEAERISPLPLQSRVWPAMLKNDSVYCISRPGSGKSLSFLLPIACSLSDDGVDMATRPDGPLALVLVPTRELGQQLTAVSKKIRRHCDVLRVSCLTGGTDKGKQLASLERRPHMVVATPGRLLDFLEDGSITLEHVKHVVLDEADKMLSLGFADQLERIRSNLGSSPRVGLFSATDPPGVKEISRAWADAPTVIRGPKDKKKDRDEQNGAEGAGGAGGANAAIAADADAADNNRISENIVQVVHVCADHKKLLKLTKHLSSVEKLYKENNERHKPRVLVFCNRIATVRSVAKQLKEQDRSVAQLHGDLSQLDREAAIRDFKGGKFNVLVATDVAARGLHVKNMAYVVNYDFPSNLETYVHRVGRTGRVTAEGHSFSFLSRSMAALAAPLIRLLESHQQAIDPNLIKLAESYKIVEEKMKAEGITVGHGKQRGAKRPIRTDGDDAGEAGEGGEAAPVGFIKSKTFTGAKSGYVFTKGPRGLGFYLDAPKYRKANASKPATTAKAAKAAKTKRPKKDRKEEEAPAAKKKPKKLLPGKAWRLKGRSMADFDSD